MSASFRKTLILDGSNARACRRVLELPNNTGKKSDDPGKFARSRDVADERWSAETTLMALKQRGVIPATRNVEPAHQGSCRDRKGGVEK
jgi:hypothetical protein